MSDKLFKNTKDFTKLKDYVTFIDEGQKSLGFGEKGDEAFYHVREYLFQSLFRIVEESGPSFDAEIFFSSILTDLNDTFDAVAPSLLEVQRAKFEPKDEDVAE
jgi:hypothetical protein